MSKFAVKRIDEMEAVMGGAFKRARAELGVESFGIQVLDMPAGTDRYPEHDHAEDGQEEVYITLSGSGDIEIEGERHPIDAETIVRVGPGVTRKIWPGDDGMRVVALGGVGGKAYDPDGAPDVTQLGGPDPLAQAQQA
jgi:mannose-6-phosphate isomerase-like protein (cupin superfamily)